MAQKYQKIDGECSDHANKSKHSFYNKEEHLEIDLFQREADLHHRQLTCIKNPGHDNFTPVKELTMEDLPDSLRHKEVLEYIQAYSKIVVRIKVCHTSHSRPKDDPFLNFAGRPIYRGGTGSVT
ncbi:uncharacterized protein LOC101857580, partial [Aplysia californica]|uniref:Uncharacterized protein LOC101857580 n=1 Tax=Aplysia californica TaxID=6500 RepID=A0ABM1A3Z0_APLCA